MRFGDLLMADLNCALTCGLVPMIALFLFYWVDKKMQNEKLKKSQGTVPPKQGRELHASVLAAVQEYDSGCSLL